MKKKINIFLILLAIFLVGCGGSKPEPEQPEPETPEDETFNITELLVTEDLIELETNETYFVPVEHDGNVDFSDITFSFDNENIVSIENDTITALNPGIVVVTATAKNNDDLEGTFTIYVNNPDTPRKRLVLDIPTNSLGVGKAVSLNISNMATVNATAIEDFIFTTSNDEVLKVDDDYKLHGLQQGSATLYVKQKNCPSNSTELNITVGLQSSDTTTSGEPNNTPLVAYFEDNDFNIDAAKDEQIILEGASNYQRYHYTSSDENILIISDTGLFMAVAPGTVNVSIVSKDASTGTNTRITVKVTGNRSDDFMEKMIAVALAEEGYREWTGNNDTKFGEWNNCNYQAWCATFVSYCANNAGVPKNIVCRSISVTVIMNTFDNWDRFYYKESYTPVRGDLIIFKSDGASHVGIVLSSDATTVYTIEGNTSNMVAKRSYPLNHSTITGYCHPNY